MLKRGNFQAAHAKEIDMWINSHKSEGSGSFHYNIIFKNDWPEDILRCAQDLIKNYLVSKGLSHSEFMFVRELHNDLEMFEIFVSWSEEDNQKAIEAGYKMTIIK